MVGWEHAVVAGPATLGTMLMLALGAGSCDKLLISLSATWVAPQILPKII
jgi:hypothetical protein